MNKVHDIEINRMLNLANDARVRAYAPYSKFRVGACLKAGSGAYYLGCNVENASYSVTNCAERTALFRAVYEGERVFDGIAVVSDSENCIPPCGVCLQALAEFCSPDMPVICANNVGVYHVYSMGDLLPHAFSKADMDMESGK